MTSGFKPTIAIRRGTTEEWEKSNEVLADGEPAYNKSTRELKVGDGITPFSLLEPVRVLESGNKQDDSSKPEIAIPEFLQKDKILNLYNDNIDRKDVKYMMLSMVAALVIVGIICISVVANISVGMKATMKYQDQSIESLQKENEDLEEELKDQKKTVNDLNDTVEELEKKLDMEEENSDSDSDSEY